MYWAAEKNVNAEEKFLHIVVWGNCSWLHDDITAYSPHSDWDLYFSCQCFSEDVSFGSGRLCDEHLSLFSVKDWLMLWCCAIYFIYLLSVHSLVDVASFFQTFARRSGLGGSLAAGQIHQTQLAHLLAARLERNHTTERRFIKRDDVKSLLDVAERKTSASCSLRRLADDSWIVLCVHLAFLSNPCFYVRSTSRFMWRCKEKATSHNFQLNTGRITQTKWT